MVSSQSIRTKGTDVSIVEKGIYIPFEAGLEENQEAKVILTAINVEGSEVTQTFDFHITPSADSRSTFIFTITVRW